VKAGRLGGWRLGGWRLGGWEAGKAWTAGKGGEGRGRWEKGEVVLRKVRKCV